MTYPTREEIRSLCTDQSFERGVDYWEQGRIRDIDTDGEEIRATVRGSREYDVAIDVDDDSIRTHCSCPYDHAGDCKHIVAVLLAVDDRDTEAADTTNTGLSGDSADSVDDLPESVAVETLLEQATADELQTFLQSILEANRTIRDRFVAFAGEKTGNTVYDYKQEIDRLFENAAGRGGMIESDTHIDFSQYNDLATTHRERGHVDAATDIYRALAETIRENMDRIDDSSGHYSYKLQDAIESYAETVAEQEFDHERNQPYIDYLFEAYIESEYLFVSEYYDDALRTVCTTRYDHEHWLYRVDEYVPGLDLELVELKTHPTERLDRDTSLVDGQSTASSRSPSSDAPDQEDSRDRSEDSLAVSDFIDGPLAVEDFIGNAFDVEHFAVCPLELPYFVGDVFEELRVDAPTTIERHTMDFESSTLDTGETEIASSLRTRALVSMCRYLLLELGAGNALTALYEETYLEASCFCRQYAERLIDDGNEDHALTVIEDGLDTFELVSDFRWLAADLYADSDPEQYRETLKRLFLDHSEWAAYDELKNTCDDSAWQSIYTTFERDLNENSPQRLIELYVYEMDLETAFFELQKRENLSWLRQYRDPVATVDPVEYFRLYKDLLIPFAANETGRRHYREVADHLDEMRQLVSERRLTEFVDDLKNTHSNRPAFLDELEKAGF